MYAFIQPATGLIRFGPKAKQYGDPWTHSVSVRPVSAVELLGFTTAESDAPTADGLDVVLRLLFAQGHEVAIIRRIREGRKPRMTAYDLLSLYGEKVIQS